jgi:FAD/FMN-containing dehydrogenase
MSNDLRGSVTGRVLLPGDDGFTDAGKPWNLSVDQPVAAVVEARDASDVAAVVRYARRAGLTVAAQVSGHGASGDVADAILLRTRQLDAVEVHPAQRRARVGAGAKWGAVLAASGPHGLTGLSGSSPAVSVVGYLLGGGLSWFGRKFGWAAGTVRALDVVDSDGEPTTVTADSDSELFWALRGGGGDFALVTAVEFDLLPAPDLYGGRMMWPAARAEDVFAAFRDVTVSASDELSIWVSRLQFPQAPPMVAVDAAYLGTAADGRELLAAFDTISDAIADKRGTVAVADLGTITAEPTDPVPTRSRTELLTELDDATAATLLAAPTEPLLSVQVRHLGGALTEAAGAADALAEPYLLYTLGPAANPELAAAVGARQREIVEAVGARVSGRKPYTFLGRGDTVASAFSAPTLARLRELKTARDPQRVFRANFPVQG